MQDNQYTIQSFAGSLRDRYPNGVSNDGRSYKDIPDNELVQKVVDKYPVYKSQISDYESTFNPSTTQKIGTDIKNRFSDVAGQVKNVGKAYNEPTSLPVKAAATGAEILRTPLKAAGAVGGTALDIAGRGIEKGMQVAKDNMPEGAPQLDYSSLDAVLKKASDAYGTVSHTLPPEISGAIGDAFNTFAGLFPSAKAVSKIPTAIKTVATETPKVASSVKNTFVKPPAIVAQKERDGVLKALVGDPGDMTKAMQKDAIGIEGKQISKGFGGTQKVEYIPSEEIKRASQILHEEAAATAKDLPTDLKKKIDFTIGDRGLEAEKYLAQNAKKVTSQEHNDMFSELLKTASKKNPQVAASKAYKDEIKNFTQRLPSTEELTTENYYKTLKQWEADVADTLPKGQATLMDTHGVASARIRAAADIRNAVRDMIGKKNPDFKPKMYDLVSLYKARDLAKHNILMFKPKNIFQANIGLIKGVGAAGAVTGGLAGIHSVANAAGSQ